MARFIIRIKDRYFEWSTVVDAPVSAGMTREQLEDYIRYEYGRQGIDRLPGRLAKIDANVDGSGTSIGIKEVICGNRAGPKESTLTVDEIYEQYTTSLLR